VSGPRGRPRGWGRRPRSRPQGWSWGWRRQPGSGRGHAVKGSGVRGEEQLGWIHGEDDLGRIHGGVGAHPLSPVVKRSCFGSYPIAYGEEKRLKGILVSLGGKNDLE
jgi:hypothetical protein